MSQQFVNRNEELAMFEERYNSKEAEFIVLYGRRRIGKTELVLKFLEGKKGIYFLSSKEGDKENISALANEFSILLKDDFFSGRDFSDWHALFSAFVNHLAFNSMKDKVVLAIDEFPYLIHSNNAIPSIFQKIWELLLKKKNIMLILLGSSVSVMESDVLSYKSPLYGRRTGQWHMDQLDFRWLKSFLKNYNLENLIRTWFVCGGVPQYLKQFSSELSFFENIKENILSKGAYLNMEADIILNEEFREPKNYKLILKSISIGNNTLGSICNDTGLDKSMVSKYLDVLERMDMVSDNSPILSSFKFKGRHYIIKDHYFNFWFRHVYPNRIDIAAGRSNLVLERIKKNFSCYCGQLFEKFIITHLGLIVMNMNFTKIGSQWGKFKGEKGKNTYEIDICGVNEDTKEILFAECKWKDNVDARKILLELKEKAAHVDWNNDLRKEHYAIFAKSFKDKNVKGVKLYDLKDIEKRVI